MVLWKWFITVATLASVSDEVLTDLPMVGRANATRLDGPLSNLSEIWNESFAIDEVRTNHLVELIVLAGMWKEFSGVDAVQTDPLDELTNQTIKDGVASPYPRNASRSLSKHYSTNPLFRQLVKMFSIPHSHPEQEFGSSKKSIDGVHNISQEPFDFNFRRVKRSDENVRNHSQEPIDSNDPFAPVKDALYQYAGQIAKENPHKIAPKKQIPLTLEDLNRLSDDDIRDLSYQHISVEQHTMLIYRGMMEDLRNPFLDRESRARIDGFWKWFKSFYVPQNRDHINVEALADAQWLGLDKLRDAFNTNPNEDTEEDLGFFGRFLKFFNLG